jgi:hypothetical protein
MIREIGMKDKLFGSHYRNRIGRRESNFLFKDFEPNPKVLLMM